MGSEWRTATVAELQREGVLLVEDGNHGEYRPRPDEFVADGVAFIRAADMDGGRVLFDSASRINDRAVQRITKGIGAPGDVLLSHKGTVGKVALVLDDAPRFVCSPQTTFWRTLDPNTLDRGYLYAYLRSALFRQQLDAREAETDMAPYVSLTSQRGLTVELPPLSEQRRIGRVLGSLADKIELNRRMSQTLESMARALFKSWFVDFDPVRAKADARDPGLPDQLASQFPDSFHECEGTQVPAGWGLRTVEDDFCVTMGQSPPGETYNQEGNGLPFYQGRADFGTRFPSRRVYCTAPTRLARLGDTLVCVRAPVGDTNLASEDCAIGRGLASVRHRSGAGSYTLLTMRSLADSFAAFESEGTVFGSINKHGFGAMRVTSPPIPVVLAFEKLVSPLDAQMECAHLQAGLLAELRDSLMPSLMSGSMELSEGGLDA